MPRQAPGRAQNFLSSVVLPILSLWLLPVSLAAVVLCKVQNFLRGVKRNDAHGSAGGCVIISGGRMAKGLTLARAFKRAGWKVIGVDEEGWGEVCPMRFSSAVDSFHLLPAASTSYPQYSAALLDIAKRHSATLFIPVSGAGSSVEDAQAAKGMFAATKGKCRTFIQDPETMFACHDKDEFMALVHRLGIPAPQNKMVKSVDEAMEFLAKSEGREPRFVLKCMGLDENRGDMTLFPLWGDDEKLGRTRRALEGLRLGISKDCPYVFQEYIPGQEYCTHASVVNGRITSFVTCPSNDMLMTYESYTHLPIGRRAEEWTQTFLDRLSALPTADSQPRSLNGHFSFDFILDDRDDTLHPIECNARVHTAVILLPLDEIAGCYDPSPSVKVVRPVRGVLPRSWIYNDLIMRYLPLVLPNSAILRFIHPSLPACLLTEKKKRNSKPREDAVMIRVDPTLVADDWIPFLVLWHVFWPWLLISRWWKGKKWTRLNVSTGRIFEA